MKKKVLLIILCGVCILGLTGCGNQNKEVSINGAFVVDYNNKIIYWGDRDDYDKAKLVVVFDINPKEDLLLSGSDLSITIDGEEIKGTEYEYSDRIIYDSKSVIKKGKTGKVAYLFDLEKYMYKNMDTSDIEYKLGNKKGEYSYITEGKLSLEKKDIKKVDYFEDIVKTIYPKNANDILMILSLKWRIFDVNEDAKTYRSLGFVTQQNLQCFKFAPKNGKKILNYFAEGIENNMSISNRGFLTVGVTEPERKYNLPPLNYKTLEKYYTGITKPLEELSELTNQYANGLMNVNETGSGSCYRDINITDINSKAKVIENILNK